jgi:hypothetical protein
MTAAERPGKAPAVREGGCLCGALRYRLQAPVLDVVHCHCTMCRRAGGAPVVTWVIVGRRDFSLTRGHLKMWASSPGARRGFCPDCGAQITFASEREPETLDVTLGSLDRPDDLPATRHVWAEGRLPWLHLDEDLPESPRGTEAPDGSPG